MAPEETRTRSAPRCAYAGQAVDQRADPVRVDAAGGGGQRGRADLDHDALGARSPPRGSLTRRPRRPRRRGRVARRTPRRRGDAPRRPASSPSARSGIASSMARRRWAAGRDSPKRWSSPRRPSIWAPASIPGLKSKTTALSGSPISTGSPSTAPSSTSFVLHAEPVEPVGEEADGLVVAEVGLPDPALGLLAAHAPALAGLA